MKRFTLAVAAVGAATAMFATPADAQLSSAVRPVKFGVAFGGTIPRGNDESLFTDGLKTGYHVQGQIAFQPAFVPFGLRAEVMYHKLDLEQTVEGIEVTGDLRLLAGTLNGLFSFGPALSPVRPYLIAGVGLYKSDATARAEGQELEVDATDFGINGGLGVEFKLAGFSAFAEGRIHHLFVDGNDEFPPNTPYESADKHFRFIPLTFGIMF